MASNATVPTNLAPVAGPLLLGSLFNWGLYGVLTVQVFLYHLAFPDDRWTAKSLVYGIFLLDSAQTFIVTSDAFDTYARHYGDSAQLLQQHNEWLAVPVFSSIVSCTVQMYYAYRIGFLSKSRLLMAGISLLAILQGAAGIATGVQSAIISSFEELEARAHSVTILWLVGSAVCDVVIAATMAYLLLRANTKSSETRAMITRLVQIIIETGTLTAFAAVLVLVLYVALPNRAYYTAVGAVLGKLYSNALLVLFNSRMRVSGSRAPPSTHTRGPSDDATRVHRPAARLGAKALVSFGRSTPEATSPDLGGVHVEEQVWVHTDDIEMKNPISAHVDFGGKKHAGLAESP
ncbi:uncharacterized protein PHACADRAFT_260469 [Phanerochaete carnosa HHB-10118-sp]|uniref:DUF6534 domain-containing protein n=1 Tax=Phanerochaete carnosa (strain HHB-10118-sp) TaxID=650164 RepID=K5VZH3_PHACS|nr:uncharacterized protein PHACADRAFT_260469 [Phanerochaete carnosa HHB-10118-sp]EKM52235.1 hypothetical protein PHACADRAFT_260469 [Phanerochaete carnosa HHB-10118-sp]